MKAILIICLFALTFAALPDNISNLPVAGATVPQLKDLLNQAQADRLAEIQAQNANANDRRLLAQQLVDDQKKSDVVTYETTKNAALAQNEVQYQAINPAFVQSVKAAVAANNVKVITDQLAIDRAQLNLKNDQLNNQNRTIAARLSDISALNKRIIAALTAASTLPADISKLPAAGASVGQQRDLWNASLNERAVIAIRQDHLAAQRNNIANQIAANQQKTDTVNYEINKTPALAAADQKETASDPKFVQSVKQAIQFGSVNIVQDELAIQRLQLNLQNDELTATANQVQGRLNDVIALERRLLAALGPDQFNLRN